MIGSNLYVGDFGDYQPDELLEFLSNFNLQLWFFTRGKILKHFFSINLREISCEAESQTGGATYAIMLCWPYF